MKLFCIGNWCGIHFGLYVNVWSTNQKTNEQTNQFLHTSKIQWTRECKRIWKSMHSKIKIQMGYSCAVSSMLRLNHNVVEKCELNKINAKHLTRISPICKRHRYDWMVSRRFYSSPVPFKSRKTWFIMRILHTSHTSQLNYEWYFMTS